MEVGRGGGGESSAKNQPLKQVLSRIDFTGSGGPNKDHPKWILIFKELRNTAPRKMAAVTTSMGH